MFLRNEPNFRVFLMGQSARKKDFGGLFYAIYSLRWHYGATTYPWQAERSHYKFGPFSRRSILPTVLCARQ
jgi:hypothetical protein